MTELAAQWHSPKRARHAKRTEQLFEARPCFDCMGNMIFRELLTDIHCYQLIANNFALDASACPRADMFFIVARQDLGADYILKHINPIEDAQSNNRFASLLWAMLPADDQGRAKNSILSIIRAEGLKVGSLYSGTDIYKYCWGVSL